ncbi:alpha/beta hydrolase [Kordiimonas sp. SCSIO 12610]|uniref:alpha/beta hydrolase n=1 Tax=Kordiimonas sp. SCSIO 12610 TaxID=2829597 RepID=UPI002108EA13|nr:alpha/beta hydrolase [Kordiimonas sp. SCSIO 12610]UTW55776.1 alpha/beta hydrolase [Kordiimonas sp. SCSIO 12610]
MSIRAWLVRRTIRKVFRDPLGPNATETQVAEHFPKALKAGESRMPKAPQDTVVESVEGDGFKGDWVYAPNTPKGRVIFYCHGGGYVWGGPKQYREFGWRLSVANKARVFLIDYTLAPEKVCPTQTEEALKAYDYLCAHDYATEGLVIAGDSAGGHLALATAHQIRDMGKPALQAISLISPWLDLTGSGDSVKTNNSSEVMLDPRGIAIAGEMFRGDMAVDDPRVSPLFADQSNLPPILIQVGSGEILLSDSTRLQEKLKSLGAKSDLRVWKNMHHVWPMSASVVPEGRKAITEMAEHFAKYWKS